MVKVLFFASLREQLQCDQLVVRDFSGENVRDLVHHLQYQYPEWRDIFSRKKVLSAVNQTMATLETAVVTNDEVAFFPPVTGG